MSQEPGQHGQPLLEPGGEADVECEPEYQLEGAKCVGNGKSSTTSYERRSKSRDKTKEQGSQMCPTESESECVGTNQLTSLGGHVT